MLKQANLSHWQVSQCSGWQANARLKHLLRGWMQVFRMGAIELANLIASLSSRQQPFIASYRKFNGAGFLCQNRVENKQKGETYGST